MILSETLIDMKIADMLKRQKALLDEGLDINKDGDIVKVKKEWDASVLNSGGITYRKVNNKWYRVSVCDGDNDVVLKFKFKDAMNRLVSISAKSVKEAQDVVDEVYGKGKYTVSAYYL